MPVNTLSGAVTPIESMLVFFQYLSWLNPLRDYVTISRTLLLKRVDLEVLLPNTFVLLIFTVIFLGVSKPPISPSTRLVK
ncbi:hypothetical protein [Chlorogloeopsis sp. ULAP02]|uniref:hypothetical protein n=1 Tax=Chlorogloeopsis sp. ULAP02 TaxID=3107926 RepID=UPI0031348631